MRYLALLALLVCGQAFAQTCTPTSPAWALNSIGVSLSVFVGANVTVSAGFISCAAVTGATLDIEIYDSSGTKVGQSWQTGVDFAVGQTIIATPLVYKAGPAGAYTVTAGVFTSAGVLAYWNATAASFTVTLPAQLSCLPKVQWPLAVKRGDIPTTVSTTNSKYAVYVCNMPNGYITERVIFNYSDIAAYIEPYIDGLLSLTQINTIAAPLQTPATAAEAAFMAPIVQANRPKALVAFNGSVTTRSVYTITATGTLNPSPLTGKSIAVGKACDETARITSAPVYYSVAGQTDNSGAVLPQGSYAVCVVSLPIGAN